MIITTPEANFYGTDSLVYRVSNADETSNEATVTIAVSPVNDLAVAADDSYWAWQNALLTVGAPGVLWNDYDIDGDQMFADFIGGAGSGFINLNQDGSFTYQAFAGFAGVDQIMYSGSGGAQWANITITVFPGGPPVARDDTFSVEEGGTLTIAQAALKANDADPDDDPTSTWVQANPEHGTLSQIWNLGYRYVPEPGLFGHGQLYLFA
jgi:large repetitive protein